MPSNGPVRPNDIIRFVTSQGDVVDFADWAFFRDLERLLRPNQAAAQGAFFDSARFRPGVEHLITLGGVRPIAEFFREIGVAHEISDDILERLNRWRDRLTPELLRAVGGDRFPPPLAVLRGGRR